MPGQYYTNGQVPAYQQQQQNNQSFVNYNYNSQILVDNTDQNNSSFVANGVGSSGSHYVNQQQIQNTVSIFFILGKLNQVYIDNCFVVFKSFGLN